MPSFIEILALNTEMSRHAKYVLTDGQTDGQTDGRPENIMPPPPIVGGGVREDLRISNTCTSR